MLGNFLKQSLTLAFSTPHLPPFGLPSLRPRCLGCQRQPPPLPIVAFGMPVGRPLHCRRCCAAVWDANLVAAWAWRPCASWTTWTSNRTQWSCRSRRTTPRAASCSRSVARARLVTWSEHGRGGLRDLVPLSLLCLRPSLAWMTIFDAEGAGRGALLPQARDIDGQGRVNGGQGNGTWNGPVSAAEPVSLSSDMPVARTEGQSCSLRTCSCVYYCQAEWQANRFAEEQERSFPHTIFPASETGLVTCASFCFLPFDQLLGLSLCIRGPSAFIEEKDQGGNMRFLIVTHSNYGPGNPMALFCTMRSAAWAFCQEIGHGSSTVH